MLEMWVVYDHPRDFPNNFVARRWAIGPRGEQYATHEMMIAPDLAMIQKRLIQRGLVRLIRSDRDDPKIIETWL